MRPTLIELAVAFVIAAATVALIGSLVENLITPLIGAIVGEPSFQDLTFTINDSEFTYGSFINALITFVSIAATVYFFIVLPHNKIQERRGIATGTESCPECTSDVPIAATRCPMCTAQIPVAG